MYGRKLGIGVSGGKTKGRGQYQRRCPSDRIQDSKSEQMKPLFWFTVTTLVAFWAADQFAFDGDYSAKIWKGGNLYGQEWQQDAKQWFRHHGI